MLSDRSGWVGSFISLLKHLPPLDLLILFFDLDGGGWRCF
jgi:hypothetical protein